MRNAAILRMIIEKYQQRIFSLALYLTGGGRDQAYDIAVCSFVDAICRAPEYESEKLLLVRIAREVIEKSSVAKNTPSFDESFFEDPFFEKQKTLFLIRKVLLSLPFKTKALILLRDQLHLSYRDIAAIFHIFASESHSQTVQAKVLFREKTRSMLKGME